MCKFILMTWVGPSVCATAVFDLLCGEKSLETCLLEIDFDIHVDKKICELTDAEKCNLYKDCYFEAFGEQQ